MNTPNRPINTVVPALPEGDRRPTLVRPLAGSRGTIFAGWGPKL